MRRLALLGMLLNATIWGQEPPPTNPSETSEPAASVPADDPGSKSKDQDSLPSIESFTEKMQVQHGFLDFYWDDNQGKVFLKIQKWDQPFLHVHALATGLGSNPVGLDRGQLGSEKVVQFRKIGRQVLLLQPNLRFRAVTSNQLERQAVEQSFAQSVIWGGKLVAQSGNVGLIDVTSWLLSDVHGAIQTLKRSDQGDFKVDPNRSAVYLPRCKAFPDNTELEATLTLAGSRPGRYVQQTTPDPKAISIRQHHSFIRLPDDEYQPRVYDVRSPCISMTFADYASALDQPLQQRWITRHRLKKRNPELPISEPVEPIVYYVDAGAPPQIQQALVEGASWWNEAFEAAGFKDAFQVKLLPPDADPLDVRYNVIQWVHRSTRGWSYGGSVIDPRTGEIIKGHVTLGSLRVRQDQVLFRGLEQAQLAACGAAGVAEESMLASLSAADPLEVALARIRQLSAHEVGHTIGFVHNFAASTYGGRASVMDYPAPLVKVTDDGQLDFSEAYAVGIGDWDKLSVKFAYSEFPAGVDEQPRLDQLLSQSQQAGLKFISDSDARPASAAHPEASLWDNGANAIDELERVMQVRAIALSKFSPNKLAKDRVSADIAEVLTPLYLHHRYQVQAVGKSIAGWRYQYGLAHSAQPMEMVSEAEQQRAIRALLKTLDPEALRIPRAVRLAIAPRPYSTIRDAELFPTRTGRIFDPLAAARVAADLTLAELLNRQRLARLASQSYDAPNLGVERYLPQLTADIWSQCPFRGDPELVQIGRVVRESLLDHLLPLLDGSATPEVRGATILALNQIRSKAGAQAKVDGVGQAELAFRLAQERKIELITRRPYSQAPGTDTLEQPPGSPIGQPSSIPSR